MAHSNIWFLTKHVSVRDSVLELLLDKMMQCRNKRPINSCDQVSALLDGWKEQCEIMPPGAKRLALDTYLTSATARQEFLRLLQEVREELSIELPSEALVFSYMQDIERLIQEEP